MLVRQRLISLAAKRYALTLFAQAKKDGETDALLDAWSRMAAAIDSEPGIAAYLRDPGLSAAVKLALLLKVYAQAPTESIVAGMRLLLEAQRYELFGEMADALQQISDQDKGVMRVLVRSARPVSEAQLHRLEKLLRLQEGKELVITTEIDAALIGGVQVQMEHRVIDGSVKQFVGAIDRHLHSVRVH